MGSARVYGFLAARFLILTLLADSTAACHCGNLSPTDLQTIYCTSDVVVRGKFVDAKIGDPEWYWARYDFVPTEVFKKPEVLQEIKSLYTKLVGSTCGYRHPDAFGDAEYIVTGHLIQHRIIITLCSFIKSWWQVSREQKRGLTLIYSTKCPYSF